MKIRTLVSFLICLSYSALMGQAERKWALGLSFSTDVCYRTLMNDTGGAMNDEIIKQRNESEKIKPGFTAGLNVKFVLNEMLSIESGALYSDKGYKFRQTAFIAVLEENGNVIDFVPSDGPGPIELRINYIDKYLDIPVKINFELTRHERRNTFFTAGLVGNFRLQRKIVTHHTLPEGSRHWSDPSWRSPYIEKKNGFSLFMGQGVRIRIRPRITFQAEFLFRHSVTPTYKAPIHEYLWNCGLNGVLYYRI
jgi:hypothetical protein